MSSISIERYEDNYSYVSNEKYYELFYQYNNIIILQDQAVIAMISLLFHEILQETDIIKNCKISKFNSKFKPRITLQEYLIRVSRCFKCSQECFILALIYIDRMTEYSTNFIVNSLNIHRLYTLFRK